MSQYIRNSFLQSVHTFFLSEHSKEKSERVIIIIAIISFIAHLILIELANFQLLTSKINESLAGDPIAAIYTPFSFILIYEVYLLVYYIPKSFTIYIGKQYEIITLIVIRRLFKDLSNLELTADWFTVKDDLQFTYDIITAIVLFVLIFFFYRLNQQRLAGQGREEVLPKSVQQFIRIKSIIATFLVPTLFLLAAYSLGSWLNAHFFGASLSTAEQVKDVNAVFFDEFFTILILVDVFLLLFSLTFAHQFNQVIRNSGFIISTILLRISFSVDGLLNSLLIVVAVSFGLIILAIYNQYDKITTPVDT